MAGEAPQVRYAELHTPAGCATPCACAALRPPCGAQPDERWTLWVMRTDVQGARYDLFKHVDPGQLVAELIARWVSDKKLDVEPSLVTLRLVKRGPGVPTAIEEAQASPLEPRLTLREADVVDGGSLLAVFAGGAGGASAAVAPASSMSREVELRLARLELQQRRAGVLVFSPTTVAATYRSAVQAGVVTSVASPQWFQPCPPPNAVLSVLREPLAPDALESERQARMERVAGLIAKSNDRLPLILVGRSTTPTVGSRKPDLVVFRAVEVVSGRRIAPRPISGSVLHVVCVAELKRASAGCFADADKGTALGFLEDLVRAQLWRTSGGGLARAVGFLSDGVHIIFFECTFSCQLCSEGPLVQLSAARECGPLPLDGAGAELLTGLLAASADALGHVLPDCQLATGGPVQLCAYLGAGATALGFACTRGRDAVVLKRYHASTAAPAVRLEVDALTAACGVPGVCQLLGQVDGGLLLAPVGAVAFSLRAQATAAQPAPPDGLWLPLHGSPSATTPRAVLLPAVVLPGADEFCDLVDALAGMHAVGWCHRDPRPANFFRDAGGRFVLCDLGAAARIGDAAVAADGRPWAFPFGPLAALGALARGGPPPPPAAADDFEQAARLAYVAHARDGDSLPAVHGTHTDMRAWWEMRAQSPDLVLLLSAAAAAANGAEGLARFKAAIRSVLPRAAAASPTPAVL